MRVCGVVSQEDGLTVVLEVVKCCPPAGGARRVGGRGARVVREGVGVPPLFMLVSLGVIGWDGCDIAPGFGWQRPLP